MSQSHPIDALEQLFQFQHTPHKTLAQKMRALMEFALSINEPLIVTHYFRPMSSLYTTFYAVRRVHPHPVIREYIAYEQLSDVSFRIYVKPMQVLQDPTYRPRLNSVLSAIWSAAETRAEAASRMITWDDIALAVNALAEPIEPVKPNVDSLLTFAQSDPLRFKQLIDATLSEEQAADDARLDSAINRAMNRK